MYRKHLLSGKSLVVVAALAVTASGAALADDNSMSVWTGDSYAYFNNLDYSPAHFNVARAPHTEAETMAKSSVKEQIEHRVLRTSGPWKGTATSPFRDYGE